jgi:hypothetical protein
MTASGLQPSHSGMVEGKELVCQIIIIGKKRLNYLIGSTTDAAASSPLLGCGIVILGSNTAL